MERKSCYDGLKLPCAASFPNLQTLFAAAPILQVALGCMVRTSMAYLPLSTATPCCCPPVMLLRLWLPWPMHLGWCHKERQALFHTFALPCNACRCQEVGALCQLYDGNWDLEKDEGDRFYDAACWLLPAPTVVVSTSEDGMQLDVRNARLHEVAGVLPALLAAAVPAGRSVATLCLRACGVAPSTFEGCDLAVFTRLVFIRCFAGYGGQTLQPALGSVLRQTPALLHLTVYCHIWGECLWAGLPEEAATLHRLESLNLIGTWLPHLNGVLEGMSGG